jgi:hypothetical protein
MHGLGDNIYQRAHLISAAAAHKAQGHTVYLSTPWPELFADIENLKCVRPKSRLRTQKINEDASAYPWFEGDLRREPTVRLQYSPEDLARGISILKSLGRHFPRTAPAPMSLPAELTQRRWRLSTSRPIAFIRPPTIRSEWRNEARPCRPEYLAMIAERLMDTHYVISVADLVEGQEWLADGMEMPCHLRLDRGELSAMQMLDMARRASVIVGPVGWIAPFGIASARPTFVVLGGQAAHNSPVVIAPDGAGPGKLGFGMPDRLCNCANMRHQCDKTIADPLGQFEAWAANEGICIEPTGVLRVLRA